jgi:hypothetical protein
MQPTKFLVVPVSQFLKFGVHTNRVAAFNAISP